MKNFYGLPEVIGEVVRRRRHEAGMSQSDLAGWAGLEQSYLSLLEHGKRMPGVEIIYRLAAAFQVEPMVLFAEIDRRWKERNGK